MIYDAWLKLQTHFESFAYLRLNNKGKSGRPPTLSLAEKLFLIIEKCFLTLEGIFNGTRI